MVQELANTCWALARLRQRPPESWIKQYCAALHGQLPNFKPQELSNAVWALAWLRVRPGLPLLQQFEKVSYGMLGRFKPQELSNTLWAFAKLGFRPSEAWAEKFGVQVWGGALLPALLLLLVLHGWRPVNSDHM